MVVRCCILWLGLLLALPGFSRPKDPPLPRGQIDSAKVAAQPIFNAEARALETGVNERNQRLYDSIASKTQRRAFPRMIYQLLFVNRRADSLGSGAVYDENRLLAPYAGLRIGEIRIRRNSPFAYDRNWIARTGNAFHTLTRERIIRRDLLFRSGEVFDPELVVRSQQLLLSRSYISDADIRVEVDPRDSTCVNIDLTIRDSWSIRVDAALHSEKRFTIGLSEDNLFGTGTRLTVGTNLRHSDFTYGGNTVGYEMPNIFGSFFALEVEAGRNFFEQTLRANLRKELLKPTDYALGASWSRMRDKVYFADRDTKELIKVCNIDLWGGGSYYLPSIRSSLYLTGRYNNNRFLERPEIASGINPALHDRKELLAGLGFYRERLFMTNMVYGFGIKEYIASGYRAEAVSGYTWGTYEDLIYAGLSFQAGRLTPWGYLMGGGSIGSYIDRHNGAWKQSAVDLDLQWFSRLLSYRRSRFRQFLGLNYTQGWNRLLGYEEQLRFTHENGLQALDVKAHGTTRMIVNAETVMFTPIQPWGFRFAFFGFLDAGTLGYSDNPFRNAGFTTLGLGLRIRNERLVFGTLQVRFGVAFGKGGVVGCDYVTVSSSTKHFEAFRFRPGRPEIARFQ